MNDEKEVDRLLQLLFQCAVTRVKPKISDNDGKLTLEVKGVKHIFNYDLKLPENLWFLEA